MKRSDLIPWFLFALVIPAAVSGQSELSVAAEAETPSTAPLTGPLTVQVQDSGRVVVFDNHRLTAFWMPELFLKGWQIVFFKAPGRNQQCDAVATLPDGTEVMLNISIKVGPSKLTFHATMTPSKDTHVISVRELILLPYEDWVGDAYVAGDLADAMRKNPRLKVFSANGLFDLATPFFITEYDLAHMGLEPKLRGNIEFGYYPSGHMIYLNVDALKQLKSDLAGFYSRAVEGSRPAGQ